LAVWTKLQTCHRRAWGAWEAAHRRAWEEAPPGALKAAVAAWPWLRWARARLQAWPREFLARPPWAPGDAPHTAPPPPEGRPPLPRACRDVWIWAEPLLWAEAQTYYRWA